MSPACRFGSDLTNTIRARSQQALHQEAGHTTVLTRLPPTRFRSHACLPGGVHIRDSRHRHSVVCRRALEILDAAGKLGSGGSPIVFVGKRG